MATVRPLRPAAHRHHRARGQRRHRQDLHDRRAGHPLRRRGRGPPRGDAGHHLRPGGQPGAARAGPRAAGRGRAGAGRPGGRRPGRPADRSAPGRRRRRAGQRAASGSATALAAFDAATIATTHQFCQLVLRSLGRRRRHRPGRRAWSRTSTTWSSEVVDDLYLRRFGQLADRPPFDRAEALTLGPPGRRRPAGPAGRPATPGPAPRPPPGSASPPPSAPRSSAASAGCGILSYDDLLSRLAAALEDARRPGAASGCAAAGGSCWSTSSRTPTRCSGRSSSGPSPATPTLVLIGDPKQAIYAFRGGDVVTYLTAARAARPAGPPWAPTGAATQALVDRLQVVLRGAALGDPRIVVRPVGAHRAGSRLAGAAAPARRSGSAPWPAQGFRLTKRREIPDRRRARAHIAADCAADIAGLLASGRDVRRPPGPRPPTSPSSSPPATTGCWSSAALAARGVPAVVAGGGHVFLHPGRRRVAGPAGGARAAAPLRTGSGPPRSPPFFGRDHRRAGRGRRRPDRPGGRHRCAAGRCCCAPAASPRSSRRPTSGA